MTSEGPTGRRVLPAWVISCVAALAALTVAVATHPGPLPGEVGSVRALQRLGTPVPAIAEIVQTTTGTEGVLVAAALPIGWLLRAGGRPGRVVVAVVLMTILAVQPFFKEVIDRPRPSMETVDVRADHESSSFPSGHSLGTTTVYGSAAAALWLRGRRRWAGVAAVPIVLTSCAAPVQGLHWPSDAIAGTLVGALAVWSLLPNLLQVVPGSARGRQPPGRRVG